MKKMSLLLAALITPYMLFAADVPKVGGVQADVKAQATEGTASAHVINRLTEKLPIEAFAQLDFIDEARLSPDGHRVAGLLGINGAQAIAIVSLFDKTEKTIGIRAPEDTQVDWVRWVNDDNIIVGLRALLDVETDRRYVTRVIAINRVTSKVMWLLRDLHGINASDVLWVPRDGSNSILLAGSNSIYEGHDFWPKVYRVDVATGRATVVHDGSEYVWDWYADQNGVIRLGESYDDAHYKSQTMYRSANSSSFHTFETVDIRSRKDVLRPFMYLPDDRVYVYATNDKGFDEIQEYDMKIRKRIRTVYAADDANVGGAIVSPDGQTLIGVREGPRKIHWFDAQFAELQENLDKSVADSDVVITSHSADQSKLLITVAAADMPGSIYYFDRTEGVMHRIGFINAKVRGAHLAPAKMIEYKARDGLKIEAVLTLPAGKPAKGLPLIMLPHGGPWAFDTLTYDYWAQFLANRGYAVIQPNFRGSTGYGVDFERKGEGQMGLAMQDDITDGMRWALSEGIADPKRVCIMGGSYGGYAAMWGVVKDPDQYRCSISIAGVASVRKTVNDFDTNGNHLGWGRMAPDFEAISPINFVDKIKTPMLLIHGKKDVTVNVDNSRKMYARMQRAGKNIQYVELPEADHHFQRQADRMTLLSSIETFLNKYNPADTTVAAN